jgi:hypothetical protein
VRILSIGAPLPDSQIDNYDWGSAPSFFDYDAIIVDPAVAVSELIEGILRKGSSPLTYSDEPIEDGPTTSLSVGLADLLRRRQEETLRLLGRGGLVVCFAYPDVAHPRVTSFTGAHRYYWLPAPAGASYDSAHLKPAHGTSMTVTDYEHTFADYLDSQRDNILYRVAFGEGSESLGPDAKVLARSPGGAAVAVDIEVGGGRVILLPALAPRLSTGERSSTASRLVAAIRNTLLLTAEDKAPEWLQDYSLPGIEETQSKIDDIEARLEELEVELGNARNDYRGIDRYRRMLWQEGKYGYDLPVRDALSLLGFVSLASTDAPAVFLYNGQNVLVETASGPNEIGMEAHYRLRQRLEQRIAFDGRRSPGLLVVNGFREQAPSSRPQQYADALRVAAESMRYCIVRADQLFDAARGHLEGGPDDAAFGEALLRTEGVLEFTFTPRPEPVEEPEAEPATEDAASDGAIAGPATTEQ